MPGVSSSLKGRVFSKILALLKKRPVNSQKLEQKIAELFQDPAEIDYALKLRFENGGSAIHYLIKIAPAFFLDKTNIEEIRSSFGRLTNGQETKERIATHKDKKNGNTIFHLIALYQAPKLFENMCALFQDTISFETIYLSLNKAGETPLHLLVKNNPEEALKILHNLEHLKAEKVKVEDVEQINTGGAGSAQKKDQIIFKQLLCDIKTSSDLTLLDYILTYHHEYFAQIKELFSSEELEEILHQKRIGDDYSLLEFVLKSRPGNIQILTEYFSIEPEKIRDALRDERLICGFAEGIAKIIKNEHVPLAKIKPLFDLLDPEYLELLITFDYTTSDDYEDDPKILLFNAIAKSPETIRYLIERLGDKIRNILTIRKGAPFFYSIRTNIETFKILLIYLEKHPELAQEILTAIFSNHNTIEYIVNEKPEILKLLLETAKRVNLDLKSIHDGIGLNIAQMLIRIGRLDSLLSVLEYDLSLLKTSHNSSFPLYGNELPMSDTTFFFLFFYKPQFMPQFCRWIKQDLSRLAMLKEIVIDGATFPAKASRHNILGLMAQGGYVYTTRGEPRRLDHSRIEALAAILEIFGAFWKYHETFKLEITSTLDADKESEAIIAFDLACASAAANIYLPLLQQYIGASDIDTDLRELTEAQLKLCEQFQKQIRTLFLELTKDTEDSRPRLLESKQLQRITGLTPEIFDIPRQLAEAIARLGAIGVEGAAARAARGDSHSRSEKQRRSESSGDRRSPL